MPANKSPRKCIEFGLVSRPPKRKFPTACRIALQDCPSVLPFGSALQDCTSGWPFRNAFRDRCPSRLLFKIAIPGLPLRIVFQDCPSGLALEIVVRHRPSGLPFQDCLFNFVLEGLKRVPRRSVQKDKQNDETFSNEPGTFFLEQTFVGRWCANRAARDDGSVANDVFRINVGGGVVSGERNGRSVLKRKPLRGKSCHVMKIGCSRRATCNDMPQCLFLF